MKSTLANKVGYVMERKLFNIDLEMNNMQPTLPSSKYKMATIKSEKPSETNSATDDSDKSEKEQKLSKLNRTQSEWEKNAI